MTVQLMHLVELPYASLEQEVRNAVEENPALEIYDDEAAEPETREEASREEYDAKVASKENEISALKAQVDNLTTQIQAKTADEEAVHTAVREMSTDEISKEFEKLYYANEKDD